MSYLNFQSEQEFYRKGGSKFGGANFGTNLVNLETPIQVQINKLSVELKKYSYLSKETRERLKVEMINVPNLRYMNMTYLAAALEILEHIEVDNEYDFTEYFSEYLFKDDEAFKVYFDKIADYNKTSLPNYSYMVKRVLFTYAFKINKFRNPE
jgi:hypothetical protein